MTNQIYCPSCKSKAVDGVISHMTGCPYNPKVVKAAMARQKKEHDRRCRRENLRWWIPDHTGISYSDWLGILIVVVFVIFLIGFFAGWWLQE